MTAGRRCLSYTTNCLYAEGGLPHRMCLFIRQRFHAGELLAL